MVIITLFKKRKLFYIYLDELHLFTEDEKSVVAAVAEQEAAGVVSEKVARLVDLAGAVAEVAANLLGSGLQVNLDHVVGGSVGHEDFVVFFNQKPDVGGGFLTFEHRNFLANLPICPFVPLESDKTSFLFFFGDCEELPLILGGTSQAVKAPLF